ncbi:MAG TPA: glycoside hydrolase family 127 protein [Candidatus Hydrogenedentes bacterium]|nr:glycoside hydrolase family 127 protein [Candidatus Hydrogenedentota bacterium]
MDYRRENGWSRREFHAALAAGLYVLAGKARSDTKDPSGTGGGLDTVPLAVSDTLRPLPPGSVRFTGPLNRYIRRSLERWNMGVVPYGGFVRMFREGRKMFAQGEMWGKAVRSGSLFYRYTRDAGLKDILQKTVADLLACRRENGSISCSPVASQPDGPGGDIWERKYVLLGLDEYYEQVERDPAVLDAMVAQADSVLAQVGPPPKVRIVDLGWSANHIESSTILEPILRLYRRTGFSRYLDFARYIIEEEGGAMGYNIIREALEGRDPAKIGGPYPKAYEMMSLFEGVAEYYRVTGNETWKTALMNLYRGIIEKELTLIGNGGGDQPHSPALYGEGWDYTALEQTNPAIQRMMETCAGVTWLKLCGHILRLFADPTAADCVERYAYNGLIGAMKPEGDGFSYVNLLNGRKTCVEGWGDTIDGVYVTCCNLNGPMGLASLPWLAALQATDGPVLCLYDPVRIAAKTPAGHTVAIAVDTDYPQGGIVRINVDPEREEKFSLRLRIPAWSVRTSLKVNGETIPVQPGSFARVDRIWRPGDRVELELDMRARVIDAPRGSDRRGDRFRAVVRGPVVLARDENIDPHFDRPVDLARDSDGYIEAEPVSPPGPDTLVAVRVPTADGPITLVDYASVNCWNGKRICTWLPMKTLPDEPMRGQS